jgi:hypothetical protein
LIGADEWLGHLNRRSDARWREEGLGDYRNPECTLGSRQNKPNNLARRKEPYEAERAPARRKDHVGMKGEKEQRGNRREGRGRVKGTAGKTGKFRGERRRTR